jgi:AMP-binding enzyme
MTNFLTAKPLIERPSSSVLQHSNLKQYLNWLFVKHGLHFKTYQDLWEWSVTDSEDFMESLWLFGDIKSHSYYPNVRQNDRWFVGATLNFTENIFQHKLPKKTAILRWQDGQIAPVSWAELQSQVYKMSRYLQSKHLKMGDVVHIALPDTYQAIVAYLCIAAIGAVIKSCEKVKAVFTIDVIQWEKSNNQHKSNLYFNYHLTAFNDSLCTTSSVGMRLLEYVKIVQIHQNLNTAHTFISLQKTTSQLYFFEIAALFSGATLVLCDELAKLNQVIKQTSANHFLVDDSLINLEPLTLNFIKNTTITYISNSPTVNLSGQQFCKQQRLLFNQLAINDSTKGFDFGSNNMAEISNDELLSRILGFSE